MFQRASEDQATHVCELGTTTEVSGSRLGEYVQYVMEA